MSINTTKAVVVVAAWVCPAVACWVTGNPNVAWAFIGSLIATLGLLGKIE